MEAEEKRNSLGKILLACTGSVASVKIPMIVDELLKLNVITCTAVMYNLWSDFEELLAENWDLILLTSISFC